MKKLLLFRFSVAAFFCMLCVIPALAANIKIKGAVKDKLSKEPLIGATIRLVGTQAGAVTDMDGNFELNGTGGAIDLIDLNDGRGAGNAASSISITNTLEYRNKLVGTLNSFDEPANNTGADASLFGWTGYNLSSF